MRYVFSFPDIGEGITEGTLIEWKVKKGQSVEAGDPLVEMETDKVVTDIPSPKGGTVTALYGREGDTVEVGSPLVELDIEGVHGEEAQRTVREEPWKEQDEAEAEEAGSVVGTLETAGSGSFLPASDEGLEDDRPVGGAAGESARKGTERRKPPAGGRKTLATPVARAAAKHLGIEIDRVKGTGSGGRVTKRDVEEFGGPGRRSAAGPAGGATPGAPPEPVETVPLNRARKAIAEHMARSSSTAAAMTVFEEVDIRELTAVRERYRAGYAERGVKLTYLPFVIKAAVEALKRHPRLNSEIDMDAERLYLKHTYAIGIAVDTEYGLTVPVIRDADRKSLFELASETALLAEKARNRELELDELRGGTFSITNFGPLGGIFATPIINYPQAAILGTGRIRRMYVPKGGTEAGFEEVPLLPLSLSADHRIVDGGDAARFLNDVMAFLADPMAVFME
jgi:pyruvate dehydrogenase E2 component (dihydrolipoamide acetyltransferase)